MKTTTTRTRKPLPSTETLLRVLHATHSHWRNKPSDNELRQSARFIRRMLEEWRDETDNPSYAAHNRFWCKDTMAERLLEAANVLLHTHGVEGIASTDTRQYGKDGISYCNAGDPYKTTLVYDSRTQTFHVGCWGDWIETYQERFGETEE